MFEDQDPTVIVKSLLDLHRFQRRDKSRENSRDDIGISPRLKLSFADASIAGPDQSYFCDLDSSSGSSFAKKHQQSIAGFDITKKIREKDSEILEYKAKITVLEGKLDTLNFKFKQARVEQDTEIEALRTKQLTDKEKIETLEERVKQLVDQDQKIKDHASRKWDASEFHRTQKEKRMLELFSSHVEKIQDLEQKLDGERERNAILENKNAELSSLVNLHKGDVASLEERVSTLKDQLMEFQNTKLELEMMKTKLTQSASKFKELELRLENVKDQEKHLQLFEETIQKLPVLQKELEKLKDENYMHKLTRMNIDMLKEKLTFAESRVQSFEIKCQDLMAENATLEAMRNLNEKYESIIKKEFNLEYLPPDTEFRDMIRNLKKKDHDVDHSINELKASIESHSSTKESQEELMRILKSNLEKSNYETTKNAQIIKRLQRKIFLLAKERDSLKNILVSYQSEATLNPSVIEQERVSYLETQLSDYKSEMVKLEEELDQAQKLPKYESKNEGDHAKKINQKEGTGENKQEMESMVAKLKEENEDLKAQLEHYCNKGGFNPQQTRVIHFKDNPLEKAYNDRKAEYDRLMEENEALKKRVELLEAGETSDITEKVGLKVATNETSSKLVKELEEKVNTLETRSKRIIDAFKKKSHEMREITYRLLGYRMDIREDNHYKLSNMYSDSQGDFLLFEQAENGDLQLLETDFSRTLDDLIDSYLRREESFPAFLSSITLNLFNRQTIMQSSSDQEEFEGGEEEDEEMMGDDEEEDELVEEEEEENEEEYDYHRDGPSAKRPRTQMEDDEEEEEDEDDELICLD